MPRQQAPVRRLVSLQDAADYLGVTSLTVRRMIAAGSIDAYRLPGGRAIRVDLNDVDGALSRVPSGRSA